MSLKKRLAAAALTALLALALCLPAAAEDLPSLDSTLYVGRITGIVRDSEGGVSLLTITSEAGGAYYSLLISPSTVWIDAVNREAGSAEELKEGALICAACAPQTARSNDSGGNSADPLQTYAVVLDMVEDADYTFYHVISAFAPEKEGGWKITVDQGGLELCADGATVLTDYATGEVLSLSALETGDRIMAWYGAYLAAVYPGQAHPTHLLRLPRGTKAAPAEGAVLSLTIDGVPSELTGRYESGTAMIPVAAVAQALNLKASYEKTEEGRVVTIENGTFAVMLAVDRGTISGATRIPGAMGATGPLHYGRAPYIETPGTTWAPAEILHMLGQRVILEGTQLGIEKFN